MAISSYGEATETSGVVQLLKDLDRPIEGKHVLIVEDIIDTGLTLSYLYQLLQSRNPATLKTAVLLDKPERRRTDFTPDYVGFTIPDKFVIGYGLDYNHMHRELPYVGVLSGIEAEGCFLKRILVVDGGSLRPKRGQASAQLGCIQRNRPLFAAVEAVQGLI